ncbi:MAG: PD-(D/E)XK nuclease domain-containing protein [Bacteroidota bacterium]
MDLNEQLVGYLLSVEEDKAAEIIKESEIKGSFEDVVYVGMDEWYTYSYQILIKGEFLKKIDIDYVNEKKIIEVALNKHVEIEKQAIRNISWLPLPKINSVLKEYNRNDKMKKNLIENNFDDFFRDVKSIFASISYDIKVNEAFFHSNFHILLKVLGFEIISEDETNLGRIDSVIDLENQILILEFKMSNPNVAIKQIIEKKYYEKYLIKNKKIVFIGISCNIQERNIDNWRIENYT